MYKVIIAVMLAFLCVSCTASTEPEAELPAETQETEAETEYIFEDFFSAKKAMFAAEELECAMSLYEEDSLAAFRAVKDEMNTFLSSSAEMTQAIAEDFYLRLTEAKENLRVKQGDIPRIYIKTTNGNGSVGWGYSPCDIVVVSAADEKYKVTISDDCEISLRGNSTSGAPKQPYNIRFSEKVSLLGMDKGKRWSLLANMYDKSLMRNYIAYYLGDKMGLPYTSKCRYADVYVDGKLMGNYTVIEPVTDGRGRVDIDVTNYEYIFEVDMNRSSLVYYITPIIGQRLGVMKPDVLTEEDKLIINSFFDEMEDAIFTHDMSKYSRYIDVDSFVNFYIHSEITKSIDVYDFSTKYFLKDGKLYAGPIWDYDLSMGNVSDTSGEEKYQIYCNNKGHGTGTEDSADGIWMDNFWFHELMQDPEFKALVVARFEELYPLFENLYKDNELGQNLIDWLLDNYGASFLRNYAEDGAGWRISRQYSGLAKNENLEYLEEVEWLRSWLERRVSYIAFYLMQ